MIQLKRIFYIMHMYKFYARKKYFVRFYGFFEDNADINILYFFLCIDSILF